ncbi:hypothetical protein BT96DRAFT_1048432 [Gymnopus androsaceus JB14]|uniref:RNase H type-1 domain-containing protein n=1 Tax=Gymnopus androsaceus JB14 TaxID=1447944 RepID=A0A6A4H970_9AGAR|nr:hypothetical protein BT96DRAFT_1048432 [Gymnopus androsaceus JB14]
MYRLSLGHESVQKNDDLTIHSDSQTYVNGLTKHLAKWEDEGYINSENTELLQATVVSLRKREAVTTLHWVKGHSGIEGNEKADELANEGRLKEDCDEFNLNIEQNFQLSGAKLCKITQSLAYKFIRQKKMKTLTYRIALDRRATRMGIGRAKACASEICGKTPTEGMLWKSLRHKDLGRKVRYFLWMTAHGGYKVGEYWNSIPGYETRGICQHCGTSESMEHILFECEAPGQKEIWEQTEKLWDNKPTPWIKPQFGILLSCGLTDFKDTDGNRIPGDSRLYRIVVSESAYLIWKMRNERVINERDPLPSRGVINRWLWTINSRLGTDLVLTSRKFASAKPGWSPEISRAPGASGAAGARCTAANIIM